ncbi:MAG TPA: MFS transporter [Candidatus Dormibacteraeota bacterium]|nr:MFS transporter [Candidatus Dormibacteraeota bacterium]
MARLPPQRPIGGAGGRWPAGVPGDSVRRSLSQTVTVPFRGALARLATFSPAARQFLVFSLLIGIAFAIFNLVFNLYMSALGFSNDVIGIFNALPALALLGVGLPFAAMADRIGYRLFLLGSGGLAAVASAVLTIAGARLVAVLAAGTFALAFTIVGVLGGPLLAQVSGETERVALFAVNQSLAWIAVLVGDLLGGLIPEAAARTLHTSSGSAPSIRASFAAMTALTVLALPFLVRLAGGSGPRPGAVLPVRELFRVDVSRFARILIPWLLLGIGAGMYLNFVQLYLAQRFGLSPGPIGAILAVGAALTAIVSLMAPLLSRRLGMSRTVGLFQAAGFPLVLALGFIMTLPIAVVVMYVRQLALNVQAPLSQVFGMEYVEPQQRARLATAQIVVSGIGVGGIGPLVSGFLQVRGGYQLAFSVSACFYLLAGLTFLLLFGKVRLPSEGGSLGEPL